MFKHTARRITTVTAALVVALFMTATRAQALLAKPEPGEPWVEQAPFTTPAPAETPFEVFGVSWQLALALAVAAIAAVALAFSVSVSHRRQAHRTA